MVRAGLQAIYLSGWQVAADFERQRLDVPRPVALPGQFRPRAARRRSTRRSQRADQIEHLEGGAKRDWFAPILADAEAGFGGPLNCFEIMKAYIEAGAAGVHFEDQLASREEVRPPRRQGADPDPGGDPQPRRGAARRRRLRRADDPRRPHRRRKRQADHQRRRRARPAVHHRRADARRLLPPEGRHRPRPLHRARPRLRGARRPAVVRDQPSRTSRRRAASPRRSTRNIPGKLLAYNCSPSFNWKAKLDEATIASFQRELGAMGYKFQFVTLAGFHSLNHAMFELASRLPRPRHGGLFRAAAGRVRERGGRLHRDPPPARGRHRLFRRDRHAPSRAASRRPSRSQESTEAAQFSRTASRPSRRRTMGQRYWVIGGEYSRLPLQGARAGHRGDLTAPSPTSSRRGWNGSG